MNLDFRLPQQDPCFFREIVADPQANLVEETDLVVARVNGVSIWKASVWFFRNGTRRPCLT